MFDALIDIEEPPEGGAAPRSARFASEMLVEDASTAIELPDASPRALLAAQAGTAHWLEELGGVTTDQAKPPPSLDDAARAAARNAFCSITNPYVDPMAQKSALMALSAPPAVRHLAGMLSQYDWEYVKQAKEIREVAMPSRMGRPRTSRPGTRSWISSPTPRRSSSCRGS